MRKGVFFLIRRCFRSVCDHPFLVGVLCFLIYLYRSSPFIFSLLVSASPVLVCTAILLGTLLSFGQPNIPEIEREEITTNGISVKMGISKDADKNESYYAEKKRDEGEHARELGDIHREGSLDDTTPLINKRLTEMQRENGEIWEAERELGANEERLSDEEAVENQYASIPNMNNDEHLESDYEKSEADSFDSERVNVDSLDSPPRSPWKRVDDRVEGEDEEEEEDDALESESDKAESSSPDASMADIMPMLDELHPLLDEETPQPDNMSHEGSDAGSESSPKSSMSSDDSDGGTENNKDLEVADEDNEDGEDEDDLQGDEQGQMKSAITWTEEDQKNLMDLGSSEIERNQRLENLILRRRARKNMSMVPERNLIDLESFDLGFNIAPISTARKNPFDLPRDSYDNMGLPPIPGSAPSILLPRRNPFDIPYDSSEEKPDLMGDGFQEEFTTVQSREPFFRRHESFNVGPSIYAPVKKERQSSKLRPYFMPEQMVSEESSYSPFQRQSSELSDSKVSSVPETESIEPISKREDIPEEYTPRETELISTMEHVSEHVGHGSQSSEEDEPLEFGQTEKGDVEQDEHRFQLEDAEDHYEPRGVAKSLEFQVTGYHPNSETVEQVDSRGSSSSSLSEVSERVFNETAGELSMLEGRSDDFVENPGISTRTSVGSDMSVTLVEGMPLRDPIYDSSPPAVRKNSLSSMSSDVHLESDLGLPPELVKRMVSLAESESKGSSAEMDVHIEMSPESSKPHSVIEHGSEQIDIVEIREHDNIIFESPRIEQISNSSVKASVEDHLAYHHIQGQVPSSIEIRAPLMESRLPADLSITEEETAESLKPAVGKNISSLMSSDVNIEPDHCLPPELVKKMVSVTQSESEGSSLEMDGPSNFEILPKSATPHPVTEHELGLRDLVEKREHDGEIFDACRAEQRPGSSVETSVEENLKDHDTQGHVSTSSYEKNTHGVVGSSKDKGQLEEQMNLVVSEKHIATIALQLVEGRLTEDHSIAAERTSQSPNSDADIFHEANEKLISTPSAERNVSFFDGSTAHEQTFEHFKEAQVPHTPVGSFEERQRIQILNIRELDQKISENLNSPLSPDFLSIPSMSSGAASPHVEMQTIIEEDDEIKDIDEELLKELDSVGDFTVKKWVPASDEFEKHEIVASAHSAETSTSGVVEVNPFETSKIENAIHSNTSQEEIDVHEDFECVSELQTRDTGVTESIDVSNEEFNERDGHYSPDQKMSKENTLFSQGYEDNGIPRVRTEVIKDAGLVAKKDELASLETGARDRAPKASPQVHIHTTHVMPEPEARTGEDVGLMFKKTDDKEIEKSVALEPPHSELVTGETTCEQGTLQVNMGVNYEMPIIDISLVEDATLDHKQVNFVTIDNHALPESEDHSLHVLGVRETQGISHTAQATSSEGVISLQKLVLDGNIKEQLKPKTDDGSVKVKADNANICLDNDPTVEETRSADTKKSDQKVEVREDVHSIESIKGKGKGKGKVRFLKAQVQVQALVLNQVQVILIGNKNLSSPSRTFHGAHVQFHYYFMILFA
ncbi:hypothetical protein F511_04148 [Dorcoceras hygrometricum]|uniref:Uncharacterized protein n=1 Tax=Dorcoceras hygrometricum TaxID=472368 RepID=A0A2Z7BHK2_9LAMI|nr:hypothetical protein F511_04148 [Dorcoceras hygrometricum]